MIIHNILKWVMHLFMRLRALFLSISQTGIISIHSYSNYQEYKNHQQAKTTDPERVKKWLGEEWEVKLNGFKDIFQRNHKYVEGKRKAICLGSRTGQEVKALLDLGIPAVGTDLVPFAPYTVEGDIHNLNYQNEEFDLVFTNIFDHSLYPDNFCSEMERVCKSGGVIIIHLQLGPVTDKYAETIIHDPQKVIELFRSIVVKESREIRNTFDSMNWELILEKK